MSAVQLLNDVETSDVEGKTTPVEYMSQQLDLHKKKLRALETRLQRELIDKANLQADFEHVIEQLTDLKKAAQVHEAVV